MLDPMAWIGSWGGVHRLFIYVEDEFDRGVADRVDADLETGGMRFEHFLLDFSRGEHPESNILGFAFVGLPHAGGAASDAAVAEQFRRSDPEPCVAETGANTGLDERFQHFVDDHHEISANGEFAEFA